MTIEDTGNAFVFTSGNSKQYFSYASIAVIINSSVLQFLNSETLHIIEEGTYAEFTLIGIAGTTDAESLAQYIMEAS